MQVLFTYDNIKPDRSMIEQNLIKERSYIYMTATKALERDRNIDGLIPPNQFFENTKGESKPTALFMDVIKNWTVSKFNVATRGEEKTILSRAINEISLDNKGLKDLLSKDFDSWHKLLGDLASNGFVLSKQNLEKEKRLKLVNPELEEHMILLQNQFYANLKSEGKVTQEVAAREFLSNDFNSTDVVIMEGFTYLTEIQKWFIKQCDLKGSEVVFLVPFRDEQQSFKIIETTYSDIWTTRTHLRTDVISSALDLNYLHHNLLSYEKPFSFKSTVERIQLRQYANRDREIKGCLEKLSEFFKEGLTPQEVAVVVRRPQEFTNRISDELSFSPLYYYDQKIGVSKKVKMPQNPRLLLLTPVGRFVLTLYQIWEDNQLTLDSKVFEVILGSGWLGAALQDSTAAFRAVKHQYFSHCVSKGEWIETLKKLQEDCKNKGDQRSPSGLVRSEIVENWIQVIELIESACRRLFSTNTSSISNHIKKLQEQLELLVPDELRRTEKAILEEIKKVFEDLVSYFGLPLTAAEFGDTIHALTREQEKADETEGKEELEPEVLRVISPEAIDGTQYKALIYLACDNVHAPTLYSEPWPFYEDKRKEHLEKERYMFMTVCRSATEYLILSYAQKDAERSFQPSLYYQEIEELLNISRKKQDILENLVAYELPINRKKMSNIRTRSANYNFNEIVHYGLCPLRYKLEMLHPEAKMYRTEFQLTIFAQSLWLNCIMEDLKNSSTNKSLKNQGLTYLAYTFLEKNKEYVKSVFPAFNTVTWHAIEARVNNQLKYLTRPKVDRSYKSLAEGHTGGMHVQIDDEPEERIIFVEFKIPYIMETLYPVPMTSALQVSEWLLPGKREDNTKTKFDFLDIQGLKIFKSQYQAVRWWDEGIQAYYAFSHERNDRGKQMFEKHYDEMPQIFANWIEGIEINKFPKNAGDHCTSCPVKLECLGIKETETEEEE